jgi:hypothetical protein
MRSVRWGRVTTRVSPNSRLHRGLRAGRRPRERRPRSPWILGKRGSGPKRNRDFSYLARAPFRDSPNPPPRVRPDVGHEAPSARSRRASHLARRGPAESVGAARRLASEGSADSPCHGPAPASPPVARVGFRSPRNRTDRGNLGAFRRNTLRRPGSGTRGDRGFPWRNAVPVACGVPLSRPVRRPRSSGRRQPWAVRTRSRMRSTSVRNASSVASRSAIFVVA